MSRIASVFALTAVLLVLPPALRAQQSGTGLPNGSAFSVSLGRLFIPKEPDWGITEVMLRFTNLRRNSLSFDAGLGLLGANGVAGVATEIGPAFSIGVPGGMVLLRAGATGLVAVSDGGGGAAYGAYAGAGLLFRIANGVGLRLDASRQFYSGGVGMWSVGAGISLLPRVR
jgi:hypothetical protein